MCSFVGRPPESTFAPTSRLLSPESADEEPMTFPDGSQMDLGPRSNTGRRVKVTEYKSQKVLRNFVARRLHVFLSDFLLLNCYGCLFYS